MPRKLLASVLYDDNLTNTTIGITFYLREAMDEQPATSGREEIVLKSKF